jgi:hypothetical protein
MGKCKCEETNGGMVEGSVDWWVGRWSKWIGEEIYGEMVDGWMNGWMDS